jgi:hypothetical protein
MLESSIPLRPVLRKLMKLLPDRRWSATALHMQARKLVPDITMNEVMDALNWNLMKGFVDSAYNNELECDVWFLTKHGKDHQEED